MNKVWKDIKKHLSSKNTQRNLLILSFLLICIGLFIYMEKQQTELNTIYDIVNSKNNNIETFTSGISIEIDGIGINNYNGNNKLKLLNGNDEFNFEIGGITNKNITSIKFINTSGIYQNVELNKNDWLLVDNEDKTDIDKSDIDKPDTDNLNEKTVKFSQFLNLDTTYKMIMGYEDGDKYGKTIDYVLHTSMELNYKKPEGNSMEDDLDLTLTTEIKDNTVNNINDGTNTLITSNMKQFNYVQFKIIKPNLSTVRVKLLETYFETDDARKEYLKKLEQFDKLVPLKFNIVLQLIKEIGDNQYTPFSEMDLHKHRKEHPIPERIILPNPNCNNCELQIRNVIKDRIYNMQIRLEYYYLDNIKNIRATPYLNFNFIVDDDDGNNSFSISKLDIVGKLEENEKLQKIFEDEQIQQDTNLDGIEKDFNKLIN